MLQIKTVCRNLRQFVLKASYWLNVGPSPCLKGVFDSCGACRTLYQLVECVSFFMTLVLTDSYFVSAESIEPYLTSAGSRLIGLGLRHRFNWCWWSEMLSVCTVGYISCGLFPGLIYEQFWVWVHLYIALCIYIKLIHSAWIVSAPILGSVFWEQSLVRAIQCAVSLLHTPHLSASLTRPLSSPSSVCPLF